MAICDAMDAPIRLMHADGAIIRNNRFILKDAAHQRVISLFDTGEFVFEGNTFTGLNDLKDAAQAFTGAVKTKTTVPNKIDNSFWARQWDVFH